MGISVVFILILGICCTAAVGQGEDDLWTLPLTIEANPPCGEEGFCERGTVETGHRVYTALTEDIVDVERCYSFCFSNVSNLLTNIFSCYPEFRYRDGLYPLSLFVHAVDREWRGIVRHLF